MRLKIDFNIRFTKWIIVVSAIVIVIVAGSVIGYSMLADKNPLPPDIKSQLSFSAVYPKRFLRSAVNQDTLNYIPSQKTLVFTVETAGTSIFLSEQPASGDSTNPNIVYYESLGLHPSTEIQTTLGMVVMVNFYDTNSYTSAGQNAILADNGTLVIAHPTQNITAEAWKSFFNSLHLYK